MSDTVYQSIWNEDEHRFTVSTRNEAGEWINPNADILLDEQVKAKGKRQIDLATNPLFAAINFEKMASNTLYQSFIALLDNYAVQFRDPETVSPAEEHEIDRFLDVALATRPMEIAFSYVSESLVKGMSSEIFRVEVKRMWFEVYTNFYRGKSTHYCTGFEHAFVGEGKYKRRGQSSNTKGEVSGYHSWVKFALDETNERVNYLGYKYDLGGPGPDNPHVVTLQMIWNHFDMQGSFVAELFKELGGFFVGCSPACELALATVAFYEGHRGLLDNQKKRIQLGEGTYDLVMYHETTQEGELGLHIRSFFPKYLGDGSASNNGTDQVKVKPQIQNLQNNGPLRITLAQPNPEGDDLGNEWVEIKNFTDEAIVLTGYELRDKMSRPQTIDAEALMPDETLRIIATRKSVHFMQMSNRRGLISLHDPSGEMIAAVSYGQASEGEVLIFSVESAITQSTQ